MTKFDPRLGPIVTKDGASRRKSHIYKVHTLSLAFPVHVFTQKGANETEEKKKTDNMTIEKKIQHKRYNQGIVLKWRENKSK